MTTVDEEAPAVETTPPPEVVSVPATALRWSNPVVKRAAVTALGLAVAGAVAVAAASTWSRLPSFSWRLDPAWLVGSVIALLALQLAHAGLWRRVLKALGEDLDPRRSRAIWCTSGLARYTPGSVLMPAVRVAMTRPEGVSKRLCLASVIYELALVTTGAVAIGAYALVQTPALGGGPARYLVMAIPVAALVCLHPRIFRPLADSALRRFGRQSLPAVLTGASLFELVVLYALSWLLAGAGLYALIRGIYPVAPTDALAVFAAPGVGYVAAALAFMLPGGLGARETGVAAVLSVATPVAVAVAAAVALRLVQLAIELTSAAVTPVIARRTRPR